MKYTFKIFWILNLIGIGLGFVVSFVIFWVIISIAVWNSFCSYLKLSEAVEVEGRGCLNEVRKIAENLSNRSLRAGMNISAIYMLFQMVFLAFFGQFYLIIPIIVLLVIEELLYSKITS